MKFMGKMTYLASEIKSSKKSGNQYLLCKCMDMEAKVFDFYVGSDSELYPKVLQMTHMTECQLHLDLTVNYGKTEVNLIGIEKLTKVTEK